MTCQHCQTWILDDDHRCRRCGRRVRATPSRISPATYPIAATATAAAYAFEATVELEQAPTTGIIRTDPGQQALFSTPVNEPRVIPFDSLTSAAERDAIRSRAESHRPAPVRSARVEVRRARPKRNGSADQRRLEFFGQEEVLSQPQPQLMCDAPVAPAGMRVQAALIDGMLMVCGSAMGIALFLFEGGEFTADKHLLPFLLAALLTVPLFYKVIWVLAGRDSLGTQMAGLELVDFDGKPPSKERRYQRLSGSVLSLLAAGIGLLWALVDEDKLTWHDHMSGTFPTFSIDS